MNEHLGTGAVKRPEHLKVKDFIAAAIPPYDWSKITEDPIGNVSGLFGITDQDQNGSLSCTCQTTRYGFKKALRLDISTEDLYSNVVLPAGGAYLNAPLDFARNNGVLSQTKHPDPNPETESAMIIKINDNNRIRTFQLTYSFYSDVNNIDSAAWAATQHDYCHLGIDGSWKSWSNLVDPTWNNINDWQHALMFCKDSIVLRNGIPAIKTRSSWCNSGAYCHYINKDYFANGGVFEIIGVDLKEINMTNVQFIHRAGTQEYGFYVPATSTDALKDKALNFDLPIVNPDGSVNFAAAKDVTFPQA